MKKFRVKGYVIIPTVIDITVNAHTQSEAATKVLDQFPHSQDYSFSITEDHENEVIERDNS